jgi:probable selenium-dependent hydroxylase accessory protein YqeC
MGLCQVYEFDKYSVISIVGAGGKTSFMMNLARELGMKKKVLITTTTKIYMPEKNSYHEMKIGNPNSFIMDKYTDSGVFVYGKAVNDENKLIGVDEGELNLLLHRFDHIIIEADGSKQRPLKGWKENEPVIYNGTELTVGILDIQTIGMEINTSNIHRSDIFMDITNAALGEEVSYRHLSRLITNSDGLFKASIGRRLLFINKVENMKHRNDALELVKYIDFARRVADSVIIGSLKEETYEVIF